MENTGEPSRDDRAADPDYLVRPYVIHSFDSPIDPPDEPEAAAEASASGASGWYGPDGPLAPQGPETAPLPAVLASGHRRPGGAAGRRLAVAGAPRQWYLTAYRLSIAIGAAIVVVCFVGGVLLFVLPGHSPAILASKCRPRNCDQIARQGRGSVLPVTVPSATAGTHPASGTVLPSAGRSATAGATAGHPAGTPASTATAVPSGTASTSPSAAPTASRSPAPSPTPTTPGLTPGSTISIRATTACCTSFYIRHDDNDNRVVITQITPGSPGNDKADATWIVRAGLANGSCVSFESANDPGLYLRHQDFELYLEGNDGSPQFANDATFCPQPGNSGQGYSFQSVSYPNEYIRHYDYVVYIASDGGQNRWDTSTLWPDDTSWLVSQPWM